MSDKPFYYNPWFIWSFAAVFYSYEFFLRILPTVMQPELMQAFHCNPIQFSTLSANYYYAYALMQIPVGLIIDRFQIKHVLSIACLSVALGNQILALSQSLFLANMGRIAMGIGSAFAFTGCLKIARLTFPKKTVSLVIGLTTTVGVIGAIIADTLFAFLMEHIDWHLLLNYCTIIGLFLTMMLYFSLSIQLNTTQAHTLDKTTKEIITDKAIWITALYGALLVSPIAGFAELWSVPFMMTALKITKPHAATLNAIIFIGIAFGGIFNGWLGTQLNNRKIMLSIYSLLACFSLFTLIFLYQMPKALLIFMLFLFGFSTSHMLLTFAFNSQRHSSKHTGIIIALTNTLVMFVATLSQPLIGMGLTYLKPYFSDLKSYQLVFIFLLLAQLFAHYLIRHFNDPEIKE